MGIQKNEADEICGIEERYCIDPSEVVGRSGRVNGTAREDFVSKRACVLQNE